MLNLKSHLKKPNFEDQTIEAKIRDHFDIRILESDLQSKCTSLYHSRISIMPNLRFHFETHTFRICYNTVTRHQARFPLVHDQIWSCLSPKSSLIRRRCCNAFIHIQSATISVFWPTQKLPPYLKLDSSYITAPRALPLVTRSDGGAVCVRKGIVAKCKRIVRRPLMRWKAHLFRNCVNIFCLSQKSASATLIAFSVYWLHSQFKKTSNHIKNSSCRACSPESCRTLTAF